MRFGAAGHRFLLFPSAHFSRLALAMDNLQNSLLEKTLTQRRFS
jgi:hypothetical protein